MSARAVRELRARLHEQFPDAIPVPGGLVEAVATGIAVLDAILPHGGFPRGRLSIWQPGGGATAALRAACLSTVRAGDRAIWIDGRGTITGPFWTVGPTLIRPRDRTHALRAAEALLRSGGFALAVLAGVEPAGPENVRLSRAAHEGRSAVVALTSSATAAGLKVSSRIQPHRYRWWRDPNGDPAAVNAATLDVLVTALGWNRRVEIVVPVSRYELPAALDPMLPDRRGTVQPTRSQSQDMAGV